MVRVIKERTVGEVSAVLFYSPIREEYVLGLAAPEGKRLSSGMYSLGIAEKYFEELCFSLQNEDWQSVNLIPEGRVA